MKKIKKKVLCFLLAGIATFSLSGMVMTMAEDQEGENKTVNYILNGGFRLFGGADATKDTFDTEDFSIITTDNSMELNLSFKKKYLGAENSEYGALIFSLAKEDMRGKTFTNLLKEDANGVVKVNDDGTWPMPRALNCAYPSDILTGFVFDENKNGLIDPDEDVFSWGDTIPVTDEMTLICTYQTDFIYGTSSAPLYFEQYDLMGLKYINADRPNTEIGNDTVWLQKYTEMLVDESALMEYSSLYPYSSAVSESISSNFSDGTNNYTKYFYSENSTLTRNTLTALKNIETIVFPNINRIPTGNGNGIATNQITKLSPKGGEITIVLGNEVYELGKQVFDFSSNKSSTVQKARIIIPGFSEIAGGAKRVLSYVGDPNNSIGSGKGYLEFSKDLTTVANGVNNEYLFGLKSEYDTQNDMNIVLYVKKGTTEAIYPTKDSEWYNEEYTLKTPAGFNVPVREFVGIKFALNGGKINGQPWFPDSYVDAGAVSVKDTNNTEYNVCDEKNSDSGLSYNPSSSNSSYLSAYRPSDPVREGYSFVGWQDPTGYIWSEEDWAAGGFIPAGQNGDSFVLTAVWKEASEEEIEIRLADGFRISDSGVISRDNFKINLTLGEAYTLDHESVRNMFIVEGESQYVYGLADDSFAGTTPNINFHYSGIIGESVAVMEDRTYIPVVNKVIPGGILFGFFNDVNDNGILDSDETLLRTGDSFVVTEDMNFTCWYETNMYFMPTASASLHTKYKLVDGAVSIPESNTNLTVQDLQPLYAELYAIGGDAFRDTYKFPSIELPETVESIDSNAFRDSNTVEITGLENVKIFKTKSLLRLFENGSTEDIVVSSALEGMERDAFYFERRETVFNIIFTNDAAAQGYDGITKTYLVFDGYTQVSPLGNTKQYVYVPYGQTKNYYPTIDTFAASWSSHTVHSGNNSLGANEKFMTDNSGDYLKLREYHRISFDLNGGSSAGKNILADTYMDARAVSVQTKNQNGDIQEVNLRAAGEVLKQGVTVSENYKLANLAEQDLTLLNAIKPINPVKRGYTFGGWKDQYGNMWTDDDWNKGGKTDVNYEGEVQLTAVWIAETFSIEYVLDDGINSASNPSIYTVSDTIFFEDPEKDGYRFEGWYTDADFTEKIEKVIKGTTGNLVLYAKFIGIATVNIDGVEQTVSTTGSYILPEYVQQGGNGWIIGDKVYRQGDTIDLAAGETLIIHSLVFSVSIDEDAVLYIRENDQTSSGIIFRINISFGEDVAPIESDIYFSIKDDKSEEIKQFTFSSADIRKDEKGYYVTARMNDLTSIKDISLSLECHAEFMYEGDAATSLLNAVSKDGVCIKDMAEKVKAQSDYNLLPDGYKKIIEEWCK